LSASDSKKAGIRATFKAVAWSFFGVRKGVDHDADMANLNPLYVVLAGLIACACFVVGLIIFVKYIVL
jgi:uncharacterized OsmC-like protein